MSTLGRAALLPFALLAAAQTPPATPQPKVEKAMPLQLILAAPKQPFPSGGAMPLSLSISNKGDTAAQAPAPGFASPFEYLVLSEDGTKTVTLTSARHKQMSKALGLVPRLPTRMIQVAANSGAFYKDDLGALLVSPLAAGKYQLEARFRFEDKSLLVSNRVPFEVSAPRARALRGALDADGASFLTVDFIEESKSSFFLRKRVSPSETPSSEPFKNLRSTPAEPPVDSVALALQAERPEGFYGHWAAWLAGGQLYAGLTRALDVKYTTGPIDTGLSEPALLSTGFQFADAHALFAVTGKADEQPALRLVSFPAAGAAAPADEEEAPEEEEKPRVITPPLTPAGAVQWALLSGEDQEPLELAYFWVAPDQTLWQARTNLGGDTLTAEPAAVYAAPTTVATWQATAAMAELLLAPKETGAPYRVARVNLRQPEEEVAERDLPLSTGAWKDEPVEHWLLSTRYREDAPVGAVAAGRIWVARPDRETWENVGEISKESQALSLWPVAAGGFTFSWFDPAEGYRFISIL